MIHLLLLLATLSHGMRPRLQSMLQAVPDTNCLQWLQSPAGQEFLTCESGDPGLPVPYNQTNSQTNMSGCQLTQNDYSSYCNNSCYDSVVKALQFFITTGTCLPVYEDLYKPCVNNSDCTTLGAQSPRVCYQGFCYNACTNNTECNPCQGEMCVPMGSNSSGCLGNQTFYMNGSALANRTYQNTFRGQLYSIQAACAVDNTTGRYCGMLSQNLTNQTCESLNSDWGCCANTILPSMRFCQWKNFTNTNTSNLLNCNFTTPPCGGLPAAWDFCSYNVTNNGTNSSSSSSSSSSGSSSMSSGIIGTNSSSSGMMNTSSSSGTMTNSSSSGIIINSNMSSMSTMSSMSSSSSSGSSWLISSSSSALVNTTHGNGTLGSGVADSRPISWSITVALVLAVAHMVS